MYDAYTIDVHLNARAKTVSLAWIIPGTSREIVDAGDQNVAMENHEILSQDSL
jgi:hypothetical protein